MLETTTERLRRVRERITLAAERAGRSPDEITLIAVSKTHDPPTVQLAIDAGARDLGENRVQEAAAKSGKISSDGLRWHLIGHLQSNKVRQAVLTFDVIHTVDSRELAQRLDRIAGEEGRRPIVLLQVDLAGEPARSGAHEGEMAEIVESLDVASNLDFQGLMILPPFSEQPEKTRPYFQHLRGLLDSLNRDRAPGRRLKHLSMGMSNDFEVAIEEGATMLRVGTAIFGERSKA
jgi:PLP dependent protein